MIEKYQIEKSKDNYDILKINTSSKSIYIGSKYNEKREIDKFINQIHIKTENDVYIVLGLGMGNHIDELMKIKHPNALILIVECEEEWANKFKEENKRFNLNNLSVVKNTKELKKFMYENINEYNVDYLKIISYANYNKIFKEELADIMAEINAYETTVKVNRNTKLAFAQTWFKSTMANIKYLNKCEAINEYKDRHKGKPAIIVSAGPSLNKNIEYLKKNTSAMVFCGGRTLKSVMNIDVNPDYTVIVDPMKESFELVNGYIDKIETNLIFNLGIQNDILVNHRGKKIIYNNYKIIDELCNRNIGNLYAAGSVAHTMTSAAILMGCDPIIFIGQDLAYTDDKGHADAASSPWQTNDIKNYASNNDLFVKSVDGGVVRTSPALYKFKCGIETIINMNPNVKFINATEGGALINGAENRKLSEVIDEYNLQVKKDEISNSSDIYDENINIRLKGKLNKSIVAIEKSLELYDEAIEVLKKFYNGINLGIKNQQNYNDKLKKLDESIYKLAADIIFCEDILYPALYDSNHSEKYIITTDDNEKTTKMKIVQCNLDLYQNIRKTFAENISLFKNVLEEIKNVGE